VAAALHRLAFVGVAQGDSDQTRAQKATLVPAAACITVLAGPRYARRLSAAQASL
jgi:hypothetical protein